MFDDYEFALPDDPAPTTPSVPVPPSRATDAAPPTGEPPPLRSVPPPTGRFAEMDTSGVETELVTLAGHLAAGTCRFLLLLAEFDDRQAWAGPGLRSCAHWLGWRVGMSKRTAREYLRVAHALTRLPRTTEEFASGRLSFSKVRALTRVATPASEETLLVVALHGTAAHVERAVRAARRATDPRTVHARRGLVHDTAQDGSMLIRVRVSAEDGHALLAALDAADDPTPADPPGESAPGASADEDRPSVAARRADALVRLACGGAPRAAELVVHVRVDADPPAPVDAPSDDPDEQTPVDLDALIPRPRSWIEDGPAVAPTVAARLTCSAAVRAMLVDRRGNPLYLGRRQRTVSRRQMRALRVRDRGCVVPGCDATRHLHAHHLRWWFFGGRTDLDNLALVCGHHHRLIHEHGYRLDRGGTGFVFTEPGGSVVPTAGLPTAGTTDDLAADPSIGAWTITPDWGGEPLDLDLMLARLLPELAPAAA